MTFLSTVILDVDYGLVVGIIASLIVVILRQFRFVFIFLFCYFILFLDLAQQFLVNMNEVKFIKMQNVLQM